MHGSGAALLENHFSSCYVLRHQVPCHGASCLEAKLWTILHTVLTQPGRLRSDFSVVRHPQDGCAPRGGVGAIPSGRLF